MPSFPTRIPAPDAAASPFGTGIRWVQTVQDGIDFMLTIKGTLDRAKYHEFLTIISQIDSIGFRGMVDCMEVLLHEYPALKRHFNMFLPTEYKLSLTDDNHQEKAPAANSLQGQSGQRD